MRNPGPLMITNIPLNWYVSWWGTLMRRVGRLGLVALWAVACIAASPADAHPQTRHAEAGLGWPASNPGPQASTGSSFTICAGAAGRRLS